MAERQRRSPRQARAGATVDAILQAALQLLRTEGGARFNTNRIAEAAGVSIGTLYQYFSGRPAILAALAERQAVEIRQRIADLVIADPSLSAIRAIVRVLMTSGERPEVQRLLTDAQAEHAGEGALAAHHLAFLSTIEGRAQLGVELTPESAFILTHAPISLLRAAAAEPALGLDPQALEDELVRLMEAYATALAGR
ncbi:TetR/AcrR family transcriptional regulator [Phenylobacterium conjunctum]|uniref:TetR/AcrR family transcriptional regulator n=1 Tax=Phenylobacterium conjunctum TaxID=1298959 RepID=A0ABW3T0S3_9CAUL